MATQQTVERPHGQHDRRDQPTKGHRDSGGGVIRGATHIERLELECKRLEKEIEKKKYDRPVVKIHTGVFWTILMAYTMLAAMIVFTSGFCVVFGGDQKLFSISSFIFTLRHLGMIGILGVLGHFLGLSLGSVMLDDWAGLTFFGQPVRKYSQAGLAIQLFGLFKMIKEPRGFYEIQYPGPAEKVVRHKFEEEPSDKSGKTGKEEKYLPGEVRPVFVTTGPPTAEELETLKALAKDGLAEETAVLYRQFTVDVSWFMHWGVDDLFVYERMVPGDNPAERKAEVEKWLRQISEAELKETFRQLTPATVIQCWELVGKRLALRLRKIALDRGVWIDRAGLSEQNLSHETHAKQAASIRAAFDKIKSFRDAESKRYLLEQEGHGRATAASALGLANADAEKARLEAQAAGYKKIADDLDMTVKEVAYLAGVAEKIAAGSNYSLYGGAAGVADFLAAVSAAKATPPATGTSTGPKS